MTSTHGSLSTPNRLVLLPSVLSGHCGALIDGNGLKYAAGVRGTCSVWSFVMTSLIHTHRVLARCLAVALGCATFGAFAQTADILWRNTTTGYNVVWKGGNHLDTRPVARVANLDWQVIGTSRSSLNGAMSVIWRNRVDGRIEAWPSARWDAAFSLPSVPKQTWLLAGMGYFDAATQLFDLLWRDNATGRNAIWNRGLAGTSSVGLPALSQLAWRVVGIADFTGDGKADILWRDMASGRNMIWPAADAELTIPLATVANQAWIVAAVGDFHRNPWEF